MHNWHLSNDALPVTAAMHLVVPRLCLWIAIERLWIAVGACGLQLSVLTCEEDRLHGLQPRVPFLVNTWWRLVFACEYNSALSDNVNEARDLQAWWKGTNMQLSSWLQLTCTAHVPAW